MVFIAAMCWLAYDSINRMVESEGQVDHAIMVIANVREFDADLKKAQSANRAYMIYQNPYFLKNSQASTQRILPLALQTQQMIQDDPSLRSFFVELIPIMQKRVEAAENFFNLLRTGRVKEAQSLFKNPNTIEINTRIDTIISGILVQEQNFLADQREQTSAHAKRILLVLVAGAVTATLFAFLSLFAIGQEMRKREGAQELLQLNEHRLFQFLEAVPLGLFVFDKEGKPFYANQKARELLGKGIIPFTESKDLSTNYGIYVAGTEEPYPMEQSPLIRALKGEKSSIEDMEIHHPDGRNIPIQVWGTPVTDLKGRVNFSLLVFSDITERKQVEEMKQSLISVASHQLKTPVAEINGYIENFLDGLVGELTEQQKDYLMDMREIGLSNYRLISDFLNLSKIQRGLLTPSLERASLKDIVEFGLRDYHMTMERKGLDLKLEGLDQEIFVMADMDKTVEALRNIVSNAVKFTDKGSLTVTAKVDGRWGRLRIADTGPGISETAMKQMFSQKRILGEEAGRAGAGIGLYIVKRFMDAQGGEVAIETQQGKGTCFTLSLPLAP